MKLWQERKRAMAPPKGRTDRETYDRQTAWAAGTEFFQHRDPLYHVTENFMLSFDAMGRKHAAEVAGEETETFPRWGQNGPETKEGVSDPTDTSSFYQRRSPEEQGMLRRFSETAFQRGTLSGAVLQGTGTMMLFSCLKKTVGQSQPDRWQQRKLFEKGSPIRNLPSYGHTKMIFNRGFTDSAVGIVVNVLRDARRNVEDMQTMLRGNTDMGEGPASTLRTMYPFLDDSRERALLAQYREKLRTTPEQDPEGRAALQSAIVRTEALAAKKAQMKNEFINKLRFLSDRATEALASFTEPGFVDELQEALENAFPPEPPPPEEPDGGMPPEEGDARAGDPDAGEDQPAGDPAGEPPGGEPGAGPDPSTDPQR